MRVDAEVVVKQIEVDLEVNRAIEVARRDFAESANAILRRLLGVDVSPPAATQPRVRFPRSSGAYSVVIGTDAIEGNSLKELLRHVILHAEKRQPGFITELATRPTPKGRYIVARHPAGLYPKNKQLIEFAGKLDEQWWYDTNVGRSQVQAYLRTFATMLRLPDIPRILRRTEKSGAAR